MDITSKTRVSKKIAKFGLISNKQALAVSFNPVVMQDDVHYCKHHEYNSKVEVNVAPVMPAQRKKCFYVFGAPAAVQGSTATARAGRQDELHDGAGRGQARQDDEAEKVNHKI